MKKLILSLIAAGVASLVVSANAQPGPPGEGGPGGPDQPGPPPEIGGNAPDAGSPATANADTNNAATAINPTTTVREPGVVTPSQRGPAPFEEIQSQFMPPTQAGTNVNDLTLNFTHAPLDMVLNYLSDAAGFIIIQDTRVTGTVTVNGKHLTQDEAVDLLNAVLNKNNYAAIRDGRTLTIVDKNDAKTREIPVKNGNIPDQIPKNAEIVTWVIPIRFVEARQLVSDLSSFVSPQATVVANEAGNSIVITDTQANIHHLAEIIKAVDDSAEAETEIRVFRLEHANPNDVATELTSVFPSSTSGNNTQSPIRFGGGPGGGGPGGFFRQMMANAAGAGNSSSDRIKKATQVSAVADGRISAVIVTAPKDLMEQIASMMKDLDVASDRDQDVYVFPMKNGDSQAAALVLQNMFQSSSSRNTQSSQNQNSALTQRQINNNNSSSSSSSSSGTTGLGTSGGARTGGGTSF
jgi:type II secretory pathway component GspD/PulD (secretin)